MNSLVKGRDAPSFKASTISNSPISLSKLRGQVVLLSFWTPLCGSSYKEDISHLETLQSKYGDKDLQLISIAFSDSTKHVQQFVEKHDMNWPQIQQATIRDAPPLATRYNITNVPDTYLIDRNGKIVAKHFQGDAIEENVAALMENAKTPSS
jgi:peroxiredoxin